MAPPWSQQGRQNEGQRGQEQGQEEADRVSQGLSGLLPGGVVQPGSFGSQWGARAEVLHRTKQPESKGRRQKVRPAVQELWTQGKTMLLVVTYGVKQGHFGPDLLYSCPLNVSTCNFLHLH